MAIKAGQILHDVNGYVIDRIQTGGPGALNIPEEKVYELGNYNTVAIVRDIPDLSFDLESVDVSTEFESILVNQTPVWDGGTTTEFDFGVSVPIDVVSPFKSTKGAFDIVKGLVVPCLSLERVTYRFGVRQNSTQSFTLRGDSIYYVPGVPHYEERLISAGTGGTDSIFAFGFNGSNGTAAIKFNEGADEIYALSVTVVNAASGKYKRLFFGDDYTNTSTGFTLVNKTGTDWIALGYDHIRFTYGSNASNTSYPQAANVTGGPATGKATHQGISVKPAAVRGKDIDVYVGMAGGTPVWTRFRGVQSAEVSRSVNLQNDEELGNHHYVAQDYLTAEVRGSLGVKPYDMDELWEQLEKITGVEADTVIGPQLSQTVMLKILIRDPDDGTVLKAIYVEDARFQVPGMQGRANQKVETTFTFMSDGGNIKVYDGTDAAGISVA